MTHLDLMLKQRAATTLAVVGTSESRRSERARRATERFAEGWFGEKLPRLSLALGVGVVGEADPGHAGGKSKALSNGGDEPVVLGSHADGRIRTPDVIGEGQDSTASEPRRSERERKATERFVEGGFGARLPRLSAALGLAVAERQDK